MVRKHRSFFYLAFSPRAAYISGKIFLPSLLVLGLIAGIFGVLAYFVTPKDKDREK
jgi:hypothetical protein